MRHISKIVVCLVLFVLSLSAKAHTMNFSTLLVEQESENSWLINFLHSSKSKSRTNLALPVGCSIQVQNQSKPKKNQMASLWWVSCLEGSELTSFSLMNRADLQVYYQVKYLDGFSYQELLDGNVTRFGVVDLKVPERQSTVTSHESYQYLSLGFSHIAEGYDHLAFVLLVLFLVSRMKAILAVVTAFTVGHSLTLILASYDLITINQKFVEWMIALSILFMAHEIIHKRRSLTRDYPAVIALLFGLIHGLGFASVLSEIGLPEDNKLAALLFFNIGVEVGQIAFIGVTFPLIYWLSKHANKIGSSAIAFSIGSLASYWLILRSFA